MQNNFVRNRPKQPSYLNIKMKAILDFRNKSQRIWADTEISPWGYIFYRILKQIPKVSCCWQISAIFLYSQKLFTFCFSFLICHGHKASPFWICFCFWSSRVEIIEMGKRYKITILHRVLMRKKMFFITYNLYRYLYRCNKPFPTLYWW